MKKDEKVWIWRAVSVEWTNIFKPVTKEDIEITEEIKLLNYADGEDLKKLRIIREAYIREEPLLQILRRIFHVQDVKEVVAAFERYASLEQVKPLVHRCKYMKQAHKLITESLNFGMRVWNEQCYPEMSPLVYTALVQDDVSILTPELAGIALDAPKHIFIHFVSSHKKVETEAWCAICNDHIKTSRNINLPLQKHLLSFIYEHRDFSGSTSHKRAHLEFYRENSVKDASNLLYERISDNGIPRMDNDRWFLNKIQLMKERQMVIIQDTRLEMIERKGCKPFHKVDEMVFNLENKSSAIPAFYNQNDSKEPLIRRKTIQRTPIFIKLKGLLNVAQKSGKQQSHEEL